jgi:hypothetical protein
MDLQAAHTMNSKKWSLAKIAAFICFAAACGLLMGSLSGLPSAKANVAQWTTTSLR